MRRGDIIHRLLGGAEVRPGDVLVATDAVGREHTMVAASTLLMGADFPVVWVREPGRSDEHAVPWPETALRRP